MARDSDAIFTEKWADGGDTGEPVGFNRNIGWPLSYSQPGGEYPTRLLFNLLFLELSALAIEINEGGTGLEYNATIDYIARAIVRGSDGGHYVALSANGPATAAVDPVGDLTGVWELFNLHTYDSTMTGNETFTFPATPETKYFLDPNGAHRNFDPSGTFPKGFIAVVINVGGSYNIVFDSGASAQTLTPGSMGTFIYDGSNWW